MLVMKRREFIKYSSCGLVAIAAGTLDFPLLFHSRVFAAGQIVDLTMEGALVEMIDQTQVFHWLFSSPASGPSFPGPVIYARSGDEITINLTNHLDEPHAFRIVSTDIRSGSIPPGGISTITFTAPAAGTYLYLDPLNAPVNRVLGLHGLLVVLPQTGNTPYSFPTAPVQELFNDLGRSEVFPGEGWVPEHSRIWLIGSIDPRFNERARLGEMIDPVQFTATFLPRYFTINGKSGVFASHAKDVTPKGRIGQPHLIRMVNAGMAAHSPHLHANHFYVLSLNNKVSDNVLDVDTFAVAPLDRVDILIPFIRPPDIPGDERIPLRHLIPNELATVLITPQSPLGWPMHCHMEMSQTAAGGNYPQGVVTHFEITGDLDGVDFPHPVPVAGRPRVRVAKKGV